MTIEFIPEYKTAEAVLKALASFPAGSPQRAIILSKESNRKKVLSSGANVVLYSGTAHKANTPEKMLDTVFLGLIERLSAKTGIPDGIGNLGGLSERTDSQQFNQMNFTEKKGLLGKKDDVVLSPQGQIVLTNNLDWISRNNIQREAREELGNIGVSTNSINFEKMVPIPLKQVKDDYYILNKWNGQGIAYAITPFSYLLKIGEDILEAISQSSHTNKHENQSEVLHFQKMKLSDALCRFGKPAKSTSSSLEIRDMTSDYRYPHEWLAAWCLAALQLNRDEQKLITLARGLQKKTPYLIDFEYAAQQMNQTPKDMAQTIGISTPGLLKMIQTIKNQFASNQHLRKTNVSHRSS